MEVEIQLVIELNHWKYKVETMDQFIFRVYSSARLGFFLVWDERK